MEDELKARNSIVSRDFRDLIGREFPGVHRNPAHWRMIDHLLLGTFRSNDTGKLLIDQSILASIEGKQALLEQRNYVGENYLIEFQSDVIPGFEWSEWDYEDSKCRTVINLPLSIEIKEAVTSEIWQWNDRSDLVYMADGSKPTPAKRKLFREIDRCEALEESARAGCEDARRLLLYLNNLPTNKFARLLEYLPSAYEAARAIGDENKRSHQLAVLKVVSQEAKPLYQPSSQGKTVRIFPLTSSMLMLRKELRRVLTQEWHEADLQNSQLAICAKEWDVPVAQKFLRSGGSVWPYLMRHMQLEETPDNKAVLKTSLYSLMFGKTLDNLQAELMCEFQDTVTVRLFFSCPLIEAMLNGRRRRTDEIKKAGGAINAYDQWLSTKEYNTRSILAQLAQATELKLLSPVINVATDHTDNNGFSILLWQHDGFCWSPDRSKQGESWTNRLKEMVASQARQMGIITELIVGPPRSM
jgi:hypothetical protein